MENRKYLYELLNECSTKIVNATINGVDEQELASLVNVSAFIMDEIRGHKSNRSKVTYNRTDYSKRSGKYPWGSKRDIKTTIVFTDVIFENRNEAEETLTAMKELLSKYGQVTVSDINELFDRESHFEHTQIGWTDLSNVAILTDDGCYRIKLPQPTSLN